MFLSPSILRHSKTNENLKPKVSVGKKIQIQVIFYASLDATSTSIKGHPALGSQE